MSREEKSIFVDEEVAPQLLAIVRDAQKSVVIVTPYLDFGEWQHVKQAIRAAVDRGVKVTFIIRKEPNGLGSSAADDVRWLLDNNVKVFWVELLHAKIYLNEKTTLLSSMNLYKFSASNSLEVAIVVRNQQDAQLVRDYVFKHLAKQATPLPLTSPPPHASQTEVERRGATGSSGVCIRCGRPIALDPRRPLCPDCYGAWSEWENVDYQENYCHICGRASPTSYAKPLCRECYQQVR